ncbi:MAG: DUF4444 domain-containing protein [Pseudomonadota bacterium]
MSTPHLPPLFSVMATAGADPFAVACSEARKGCDAGLVTYDIQTDSLRAAIVFAPEVPLREAAMSLPICGIGFQNALGALAPPEVSLHLEWAGGIRLNGARCGHLAMAAEPEDPDGTPDWLSVGLKLCLWDATEDTGATPDKTTLFHEGCSEIDPNQLLEAWVRHTLVWLNRWLEEGPRPVHAAWQGLAHGHKEPSQVAGQTGTFVGVDEDFGMLLQSDDRTRMIPLTDILTEAP